MCGQISVPTLPVGARSLYGVCGAHCNLQTLVLARGGDAAGPLEGLKGDANGDISWSAWSDWGLSLGATHGGKKAMAVLAHMIRCVPIQRHIVLARFLTPGCFF